MRTSPTATCLECLLGRSISRKNLVDKGWSSKQNMYRNDARRRAQRFSVCGLRSVRQRGTAGSNESHVRFCRQRVPTVTRINRGFALEPRVPGVTHSSLDSISLRFSASVRESYPVAEILSRMRSISVVRSASPEPEVLPGCIL